MCQLYVILFFKFTIVDYTTFNTNAQLNKKLIKTCIICVSTNLIIILVFYYRSNSEKESNFRFF